MTFSTRISIQWPPESAEETTKTYVITSPKHNHFVDIRSYLNPSSIKPRGIPFEWALAGVEEDVGSGKILFHHEIDSQSILNSDSTRDPTQPPAADLGHFEQLPNGDRKETGEMRNPATGKIQPYVEIWRSLDANETSPEKEMREKEGHNPEVYVLAVDDEEYKGKLIRMGNWIQGVVWEKKKSANANALSLLRAYFDGSEWKRLLEYGPISIPCNFDGNINDSIIINGIKWNCIE